MLKRVRQINISLAAKCQLLFGAAVVLIIAAALAVPWHRFEELTDELNDGPCEMLARNTIAEHVADARAALLPRDSSAVAATQPSQTESEEFDDSGLARIPRLLAVSTDPKRSDLTAFEQHALAHFQKHPDSPPLTGAYRRPNGTWGYHFARAIYLRPESCQQCHAEAAQASLRRVPFGIVTVDIPSRINSNQLLRNRLFILAAGFLAGTLAIVVFYLITTRLILQPVRVLQETAEKVSQGDLNIRADINTGDEFQQLCDTFNIMLANLKESADRLRSINKGLDLKLGQLAEANVTLFEANRLKSEFLANVSHELRTPLNSILGFAELLKDSLSAGPDSKSARYCNNILQSGKHLLDLINDLLDLAKIEAGKMEVRSEPLSLPDLFEGLSNILKPLLEQKNLSLASVVGPNVPIIRTDPGKLQQILYNFLSNAIKFSPQGERIELTAQADETDHVRISVTDHGPGIEQAKQQIIFEKFRQADASVTRSHSGTGLGLAISKELSTLLNGSIGVRSNVGEGATFWILIPLHIEAGDTDVRNRLVLTS
ncbi:MAG TPA: ATP-binding protein [Tepidisphaeraceae bacterium]|nr:ATP-binding protein [Tepidisphaeraceae bacterium]